METQERYSQAKMLAQAGGNRDQLARICTSISQLHFRKSELPQGAASAEEALTIARQGNLLEQEQGALAAAARVENTLGHLDRARGQIETALMLAESGRGSVAGSHLRATYFAAALALKQDLI